MTHYRTNLRDIEFNLFEVNRIQDALGTAPFADLDEDTARHILQEVDRLAREEFAASFVEGDRAEMKLVDGEVSLPEGFHRSLAAFYDAGWDKILLPESIGGAGAPNSLSWAAQELLIGANPAAFFYVSGTLMAGVIAAVGTPEQVERFARPMADRNWGGTMVLTEADAGSDVGAGTTRATHIEDDVYHLEGVKRFITSGESDFHENIIHLVLARPSDAGPGTKGLSMFIVPKFLVNEDGSIGERNGIVATAIEKKMGIKASTTCELTLGHERPCFGYLVGNVHDGIRQMFLIIEHARMLIGAKSIATLSTGYLNALEYAHERLQGADLTEARNKHAPRVPIINHPNVRRMLMEQKAHVEGMRALLYFGAWVQDQARIHPDDDGWLRLDDLLLPLIKGYSSEKAYELLALSLQVFGGSGFTQDYPIEQYIRDAKIDSVYEGTTGIQALDLFFRKIVRDQGQTLMGLAQRIQETAEPRPDDAFEAERAGLADALGHVQAHVGALVGSAMASTEEPAEIYKAALHATPLLMSLAELTIGWLLVRQADVAAAALERSPNGDGGFYEGKIAAARYFCRTVLPKTARRAAIAAAEDGSLMELADASW